MTLKHPEYAHGISDADLIKEAIEFCNEELDSYEGMEYDDDCEVCCQRSNTFIRELVSRLELSDTAPEIATLRAENDRHVGIGMAIAAAIIMRVWGHDTEAREILNAAGLPTEARLREFGVDDYDIDALRPLLGDRAAVAPEQEEEK